MSLLIVFAVISLVVWALLAIITMLLIVAEDEGRHYDDDF